MCVLTIFGMFDIGMAGPNRGKCIQRIHLAYFFIGVICCSEKKSYQNFVCFWSGRQSRVELSMNVKFID